jgi:hypothetical protein
LPPHASRVLDVAREVEAAGGDTMAEIVGQARRTFGFDFEEFRRGLVVSALVARGLIKERQKRGPPLDGEGPVEFHFG